jgi:hypothetical protein
LIEPLGRGAKLPHVLPDLLQAIRTSPDELLLMDGALDVFTGATEGGEIHRLSFS